MLTFGSAGDDRMWISAGPSYPGHLANKLISLEIQLTLNYGNSGETELQAA
jgi:hypothetical protein